MEWLERKAADSIMSAGNGQSGHGASSQSHATQVTRLHLCSCTGLYRSSDVNKLKGNIIKASSV